MDKKVVHVDVGDHNGWRVEQVEVFPHSAIGRVTLVRTGLPRATPRLDVQKVMFLDDLPDVGMSSKKLAELVADALYAQMARDTGRFRAVR